MLALIALGYGVYALIHSGLSVVAITMIGSYLLLSTFVVVIFAQRRHSSAKLAWLTILVLFPVVGHIIFIIFGARYTKRKPISEYRKKNTFEYEELTNSSKENKDLFNKQIQISQRGAYKADIKLYKTGYEGFEALFEDLEKAKKYIFLNYYIIKPGIIFDRFKDILFRKAAEGVKIKLIVDDFGTWALPWYVIKDFEQKGIEVAIFGKVHFPFISSENGYRSHRKMAVIDGKVVHTGGVNIADEYASLNPQYGIWLDFQIRITGEAVKSYVLLFIDDWNINKGAILSPEKYLVDNKGGKETTVLVEYSPEIEEPILMDSLINWIHNAKDEIHLATPYFIPSEEIIVALRSAALSGVKINLYLPGKPDKPAVLLASKYWASQLLPYGVKFFETKDILIHSKIGLFDKKYAYLGTANIDLRSMYSQYEMIALVEGSIVNEIDSLFLTYRKLSKELTKKDLLSNKFKNRIVGFIACIFSPMM